jgi:diguanylate cyclase (GGDEF)-like protein
MPEAEEPQIAGEEASLADLVETLENVEESLSEILASATSGKMTRTLETCVTRIGHVSAALRSLSQLHDPSGARRLGKESKDFASLAARLSESMSHLAAANERLARELGVHVGELDALAGLSPAEDLRPRLRRTLSGVRQTVSETQPHRGAIRDRVESANATISSLEREREEARQRASEDPLTRLHSRGALDEHLDDAIERGTTGGPWCLLIINVDRFKEVKDTHGDAVADALLYNVARVLERSLPHEGVDAFLARYGRADFVVVLAQADQEAAREVAERLRGGVASTRWQQQGVERRVVLRATVSIGVAQYRSGDAVADLRTRADRALYRAKKRGPNRVVVADF